MEVQPKKCDENYKTIVSLVQQAKQQGSDCIVFPELCITGYLIGDIWYSDAFVDYAKSFNDKIKQLADDIVIVWGNVATDLLDNKLTSTDGRSARYNCAFIAQHQAYAKKENTSTLPYVKHLLPNYRIFDDSRYFISGQEFETSCMFSPYLITLNNKQKRIGLEVCEDMWDKSYQTKPSQHWADKNLDVLVNISSSPYSLNKEVARERNIINQVKTYQFPCYVYVNAVGMQNTGKNVVVFDGGSCAMNNQSDYLAQANDNFNEELVTFTCDKPIQKKDSIKNKQYHALIYAIKLFDKQLFSFDTPWIVGLSGGIDSSVSAALLTKALGSDRVIGINMPSRYNQLRTINNAKQTAKALGIEYQEHSIEPLMSATTTTLELDENTPSLVLENAQARLRGHLLSTIASRINGVIANNGNKVETALGYSTLYGDTIGALAILGDCTKMEVFELATIINDDFKKEVIPQNLIPTIDKGSIQFEFKPSAELKENQVDPMKWGYHDMIVEMITNYPSYQLHHFIDQVKENTLTDETLKQYLAFYNLTSYEDFIADINWIVKQVQLAVFKRIQSPPIIMVSKGAFGSDLRENQGILPSDSVFL